MGIIAMSSSITLIASSYWAFSQFDLKKIIALSTTSQLRFIFLIISMGYIELAYLHMLFHGYFKAMLFIGRGVRIHSNSSSSQDLRNLSISNSYYSLLRAFSIFFIYFARMVTIGYSIKTLILIGKNSTLISLSNYKHEEEIYHLVPEIIPTFFLRIFVIFFPSTYLLYTNIEEIYLSLPFSK